MPLISLLLQRNGSRKRGMFIHLHQCPGIPTTSNTRVNINSNPSPESNINATIDTPSKPISHLNTNTKINGDASSSHNSVHQ